MPEDVSKSCLAEDTPIHPRGCGFRMDMISRECVRPILATMYHLTGKVATQDNYLVCLFSHRRESAAFNSCERRLRQRLDDVAVG